VLADSHGNCVYVGDRDCSLQRRHQKVVEEAPAPGLDAQLRIQIGEAACRIALKAGYVGAGTAEFLVEPDGSFWFLELNARLQVEHPVTEAVYHLDLVELQLRVAQGEALPFTQADLEPRGHAIEVRVYAEDPVTFLPTGGRVLALTLPSGPGVRVDHALSVRQNIPLAYDPLLAKVIVHGDTRDDALERLDDALSQLSIPGVVTNAPLLRHAIDLPAFAAATHDIATLEANPLEESSLAIPADIEQSARERLLRHVANDPFFALAQRAHAPAADAPQVTTHGDTIWVSSGGRDWQLPRSTIVSTAGAGDADMHGSRAVLTAPMPGTVIKALDPGTEVRSGDAVVVLEAMKMENAIAAPFDGVVGTVSCAVGELVARGATVAEVER
jgi:acetyl/propionyl-CoA carboxylase alpha subunit